MSDEIKEADSDVTSPFIIRKPWNTQPPTPVEDFDKTHPLGKYCVGAIIPAWGTPEGFYSVGQKFFFRKDASGTGSSVTRVNNNYTPWVGRASALDFNPVDDSNLTRMLNTDAGSYGFQFSNGRSFAVVGIVRTEGNGVGGVGDPRIYSKDEGTGEDDHDLMIGIALSGQYARTRIRLSTTTQTVIPTSTTIQQNALNMIIGGVFPDPGNGEGRVWCGHLREDGAYDDTVSSATVDAGYDPRLIGTNGNAHAIGATALASGPDNAFAGEIIGVFFFDMDLYGGSNSLHPLLRDFMYNPWQIFKPKEQIILPPQRRGTVFDEDLGRYVTGPVAAPVVHTIKKSAKYAHFQTLRFDGGSDSFIELPDLVGINDFSVGVWYFPTSNSVDRTVFAADNFPTTPRQEILYKHFRGTGTESQWEFSVDSNGNDISVPDPLSLNEWHYVSARRNSGTGAVTARFDDVVATIGSIDPGEFAASNVRIGCHYFSGGNNEFFVGRVGYVCFWDARLTRQEDDYLRLGGDPLAVRPQFIRFYVPGFGPKRDVIGNIPLTYGAGVKAGSRDLRLRGEGRIVLPPNEEEYDQIMVRKPSVRGRKP